MEQTTPAPQNPATHGDQRPRKLRLDTRDEQIVQQIAAGHSNREIARSIGISEQTVKNRLTAIYTMMGVKTRLELAVRALTPAVRDDSTFDARN
jgi:DNA-binding NarL/FixJ family response regulator